MDYDALKSKIVVSIKTETMREYLLRSLESECKLNALTPNSPTFLIEKASQRFENKIKACEQIEEDLSNEFISYGDYFLLSEKLEALRLKLAILYADSKESETTENNYNEIKDFILKILSFKEIPLKLKYFDLVIKLLDKITEDSQFNKEFVGALDLLILFFNEPKTHPNEQDLEYISNLVSETHEEDIRKCFYGIIRKLNKKLLFQALLKQLLKIIKNQNNSPIMQFNSIFITNCLNDPEIDFGDLNQVINLVCHALDHHNKLAISKKSRIILSKLFNQNLIDLEGFKKDLKEKISPSAINNPAKHSSREKESYLVANILKKFDFVTYFPTYINNKKIKDKLSEAKFSYAQTVEKKHTANRYFAFKHFRDELVKINNKTNEIIVNTKTLALKAKKNLEEFSETKAERVESFIKKKSETAYPEQNEKIEKKAIKTSLIQAKEKLLPIKEKLKIWNSTFTSNIEEAYDHSYSQTIINLSDLNQPIELVDGFSDSSNKEYNQLIQQVIDELEKTRDVTKGKNLWFVKSERNISSLFYTIFRCGYFSTNLTIKKIKAYLNNDLSFSKVNSFILNQSFWELLSNGIIRWPWMDKTIFAQTWAEQLNLYDAISQIEELRKNILSVDPDKEKILKEVISISEKNLPCQSKIIYILENFKKYITMTLEQLETLEQKINSHLNEKEDSLPKPRGFFMHNKDCGMITSNSRIEGNYLGVMLNV
jgi:hypothetical protein